MPRGKSWAPGCSWDFRLWCYSADAVVQFVQQPKGVQPACDWVKNVLGIRCLQFTTNCCNFSRSKRQCAGAKLKKTRWDCNEDSRQCDCGMQSGQTENAQGLPTTWLQPRLGLPIISPPASAWCIDAGGVRIWSQCIAEDGQPSGTQLIKSTFATNQQSSGRWKEASQMQRTV